MASFPNKFAGVCRVCGLPLAAGAGVCEKLGTGWAVRCAQPCVPSSNPKAKPQAATVGDLSNILALFDKARKHLKFPAIVVGIPALGPDASIRVNVAGERAKVPGSLTVVDGERDGDGERAWLGRILLDGTTLECSDMNFRDESGNETTPERELYKSQCYVFDMKPEWLDQQFSMGTGKTYIVAGLKPRGSKCVLIKSLGDLKTYVATPEQIKHAFIVKVALAKKGPTKNSLASVLSLGGSDG